MSAARPVFSRYNPHKLEIYDAAMAEDKTELARLHAETDWLAQMATEYAAERDELMPLQQDELG